MKKTLVDRPHSVFPPILAVLVSLIVPTVAEDYPSKPVRIVTHGAAGGAVDVPLRIVAEQLSRYWGQQAIVINQPGAGGGIAARAAAAAAPDGYTLYMPTTSAFAALPGSAPNLPVELPRDFAPIGLVAEVPLFVAVSPSLGVSSLPELIKLAKQKPGQLSYAVTGRGTLSHMSGELLQDRAGVRLQMVPYTGGPAQALNDVMSGRVPIIMEGYSGISGAIQNGSLKPIAVTSTERLPGFSELPTVAEFFPGFRAISYFVLAAPLGTPETVLQKVSADLRKAVAEPEVKDRLAPMGTYVRPMSASEVTTLIQSEQRFWTPILQRIAASPQ